MEQTIPRQENLAGTDKVRQSLIKSAGLIGFLTLLSRVAGMARDVVSAKIFGTSRVWDAFLYAFAVPNFLRRLVGEGALANAFIPIYTKVLKEQGREEADKVGHIVFTLLTVFLGVLVILFMIGVQATLSFFVLPEKVRLILRFLQILFPYILFLAHVALSMGILNCHRHFFTPSLSPVVLNLVWIGALFFVCPFAATLEGKGYLLAGCILLSGVIQFAVQLFPLKSLGYRARFAFEFFHPAIRKIMNLILPAVMGFAVTQISILVDMSMAFFLGDGANASLWYGNRLMQFPLGIFGVGLGTALLPTFSHQAAEENSAEIVDTLSFSIRSVFFIVIPASLGLIFLQTPIVKTLFQRGNFDAVSTYRTARVLMFYSIGLFAYSGQKAVTAAFYALEDSRTPFLVSAASLGIDILLNLILMWPLREGGLALSTSLGGILDFVVMLVLLMRKIGHAHEFGRILRSFLNITFTSLLMGISAFWIYHHLHFSFASQLTGEIVNLACTIFLAILVYLGLSFLFRVEEIRGLLRLLNFRAVQTPSEE